MRDTTFDDITRPLLTTRPRREVLRRAFTSGVASLTAAGLGAMLVPEATAARKLCRKNGSRCKQKGKGCKARYCRPAAAGLRTPFTIEAHWGDANLDRDTNLFIYPGYRWRVVDAMITNFHLPRSTLLMMISALVGCENLLHAYEVAKQEGYRFFSFGDAMFIE